ncbi:MAG: RIP metalloprotease RseP [Peptoniphilus sp.]|nr:RIP metalloprotease RseP [Peptoniphilus sp.]MDD7362970.1 RIP metalloprotease RseP [Bacillota bacterium]MDY6044210.1 RIP metalloprotease RseP [Peptoniphilus sp.]
MATILGSIFVFVLIIALHEFGHFAMAKFVGIRVNEFSIGMGPLLAKRQKNETQYSLRAIPMGGYVAMEGEESDSDDPRAFNNARLPHRAAVVASGAMMNFVLAVVAFMLFMLISGYPTTVVQDVLPNSPAYEAGIRQGDELLSIDGKKVEDWDAFSKTIASSEGLTTIGFKRGSDIEKVEVTPKQKDGRSYVGIQPTSERHPLRAIKDGFTMTGKTVALVFNVLGQLFRGDLGVDKLSGPVGVVKIIGDSAKFGFSSLMFITAYISANLGLMNLLPIPALDGGKLLFLLIEGISGKPVNEKVETSLSVVSFVLLFGLMIYVTIFGDLARFIH